MAKILNTGKLAVLGILAAGIIVFSIFFKDRMISSYAEKGLGKIFSEPVHISDLKTSILSSRISVTAMVIGDTSIENMVIDLDAAALLKKRFIIENLSGSIVRKNTGTSGETEISEVPDPDTGKLPGFSFPSVVPDPEKIVANHLDDFSAFREIEQTKILLKEKTDKFKKDTEELKLLSAGLESRTEKLSEVSITGIKEGAEALSEINSLVKEINAGIKTASVLKEEAGDSIYSIRKAEKRIQDAAEDDFRTIDSLVSDPGGSARNFASGYVRGIIENKSGKFYPVLSKGLEILNNIVAGGNGSDSRTYRRNGRTVHFRVEKLPVFLIEKGFFSFGDDAATIEIRNISSNPELLSPSKASFNLDYKSGPASADIYAEVSFDGAKYSRLAISGNLSGFTFSADGFSGRYGGSGSFVFDAGRGLTGTGTIRLSEGSITNPENKPVIEEINKALNSPEGHDITADLFTDGRSTEIKISTTLDDLVKNIIKQEASRTAENLKKDAREEYKRQLDSRMEEIQPYMDDLDNIRSEAENISQNILKYREELYSAQSRIKEETAAISPSGVDRIKDAAGSLKLPF